MKMDGNDLFLVDLLQFMHGLHINQLQFLAQINHVEIDEENHIDRTPLRNIREAYYETFSDSEFIIQFRFPRAHIDELLTLLQIPEFLPSHLINRCICTGRDALLIVLRRLAFSNRYSDMRHLFQRSEAYLCRVFNYTLHHIYIHHAHLLRIDSHERMLAKYVPEWFAAMERIGAPAASVLGCIDGMFDSYIFRIQPPPL